MLIYPTSIKVYTITYLHEVSNPSKYIYLPNMEKLILEMTEKKRLPNGF